MFYGSCNCITLFSCVRGVESVHKWRNLASVALFWWAHKQLLFRLAVRMGIVVLSQMKMFSRCRAFGRIWRHQRWSFRSLIENTEVVRISEILFNFRPRVFFWNLCETSAWSVISSSTFAETLLFHFIVLSFVHLDLKKITLHKSKDSITFSTPVFQKSETKNQPKNWICK